MPIELIFGTICCSGCKVVQDWNLELRWQSKFGSRIYSSAGVVRLLFFKCKHSSVFYWSSKGNSRALSGMFFTCYTTAVMLCFSWTYFRFRSSTMIYLYNYFTVVTFSLIATKSAHLRKNPMSLEISINCWSTDMHEKKYERANNTNGRRHLQLDRV